MSTTSQPPKPKRRYYQFSLKMEDDMRAITVLSLVALASSVGCGREPSQQEPSKHLTSGGVLIIDSDGFESPYAIAMRDENYDRAESLARDWVKESPDASASWLALTYPLLLTGQFDAAIVSCEKAMSFAPNDKRLIYTRGFIAQEQGFASYDESDQAATKY